MESQNIEYKQSWRDEYLKWLCGFANAQGGILYIGLDDNGKPVGLTDSKKLLEDLPNKIQNILKIMADVNLLISDSGKEYIKISVQPSTFPVDYRGEYHYRSGSTKQLLTGASLTQFLLSKTGAKWDAVAVDGVTVDDLDKESFDIFKKQARISNRMTDTDLQMSNEELLNKLHLTINGKLKRAAVLLFHREPENFFSGVYTKIGKFSGCEIDFMDELHGSLIMQADRILDLIYLKYLKGAISYVHGTRVETYQYAKPAIREAVYNALCHSDWSGSIPIQIKIEDSRMQISNMCMLPNGWDTATMMREHNSIPFNPDIANTFYRAGYIEAWGRGIEKICNACTEIGVQKPQYSVVGQNITITFKAKEVDNKVVNTQITDQVSDLVTDQVSDLVTDQVKRLINVLSGKELSVDEIMKLLNLRHKTHFRKVYLQPAIKLGLVSALYPSVPNHPKQKYHLTK